ncbi:unnamed protein product, partial [Cyprideis torosa]
GGSSAEEHGNSEDPEATAYVFTDMQSPERHGHAMQCYQTTHQRAAALLNWFDQVINTSIMRDLHDVNEKVKMKTLALRRERINLIKNKVEELGGKPLDIDLEAGWGDSDIDIDDLQRQINSAQIVKVAGGGNTLSDMDALHPRGASALIADMPSQEQIFVHVPKGQKVQNNAIHLDSDNGLVLQRAEDFPNTVVVSGTSQSAGRNLRSLSPVKAFFLVE